MPWKPRSKDVFVIIGWTSDESRRQDTFFKDQFRAEIRASLADPDSTLFLLDAYWEFFDCDRDDLYFGVNLIVGRHPDQSGDRQDCDWTCGTAPFFDHHVVHIVDYSPIEWKIHVRQGK
jgi:hypothetical protein